MTTPEYLSEYAAQFLSNGASIIGGCCGTDERFIGAIGTALNNL